MSSLIRKGDKKDGHLKGAFNKQAPVSATEKKNAMVRVDENVKNEINAIVQVQKLGKANDLILVMLEQYRLTMTAEDIQKVELIKDLTK